MFGAGVKGLFEGRGFVVGCGAREGTVGGGGAAIGFCMGKLMGKIYSDSV